MLQIAVIRENPERIITALKRKHFDARVIVMEIVELDEKRRSSQAALDNVLAESNKLSKDIGMLMKNGEKAKAELPWPYHVLESGRFDGPAATLFNVHQIPSLFLVNSSGTITGANPSLPLLEKMLAEQCIWQIGNPFCKGIIIALVESNCRLLDYLGGPHYR